MKAQLNELCANEIASAVCAGHLSAEDVMKAHIQRIVSREPDIQALISFDPDRAIRLAQEADQQTKKGRLHGVPFVAKDIIDTVDLPTSWGSPIYSSFQPPRNASCIELLTNAGAILLGKSVTTEFAYFSPGPTRNPHNTDHTPGGSSSGSAAAVADRMASFGLGSQTAGSLTRPAAYCGIFGYKASRGSIDLQGVMGLSPSLDSFGFMARCVDDLILIRMALCGARSTTNGNDTMISDRLAFFRGPHWGMADTYMRNVCFTVAAEIEELGLEVEEIECPVNFFELAEHHATIMAFEVSQARIFEYNKHRNLISDQFNKLMERGLATRRKDYEAAIKARDADIGTFNRIFSGYDAILTPAVGSSAPLGTEGTGDPLFSRIWTLLQLPSISIPFGTDQNKLPLAFQLIGKYKQDADLLTVAHKIETGLNIKCPVPY